MDDDALVAAVRRLKLDRPAATAKEVHQALLAEGEAVEFSHVKKACSKVTKALALEPATPATAATAATPATAATAARVS